MGGETVLGLGRTPIGPPVGVFLSADVDLALRAVAEPFGQRRRSAVVRVAIRRRLRPSGAGVGTAVLRLAGTLRRPATPRRMVCWRWKRTCRGVSVGLS